MRRFQACLIGILATCLVNCAWALDLATVQHNLDELPARKLADADFQIAQKNLQQALAFLQSEQDSLQARDALAKQLQAAPDTIKQVEQDLQDLQKQPTDFIEQSFADKPIEVLEQASLRYNQELTLAQNNLSQANALYVISQTRPERAQAEINANLLRLQDIAAQVKAAKEGSKTLASEKLDSLQAERQALEMRDLQRQDELAGNSILQDLSNAQRSFYQEQVNRLEQSIVQLQTLINKNRQETSEQTVREQSLQVTEAGSNSLLVSESKVNLQLSDYLLQATEKRNVLVQQTLRTNQQLASLKQIEAALDEQISVLKGSLLLSKILYQQRKALPKVSIDKSLANDIADIRLYQLTLRQIREQISRPEDYIEKKLVAANATNDQQLRHDLGEIVKARVGLLDRLNRELNAFLSDAISQQLNQQQLQKSVDSVRATLDEQMFWIPSNRPLDFEWLRNVPRDVSAQWEKLPLQNSASQLGKAWIDKPWIFIPLFLLIVTLLVKRKTLAQRLAKLNSQVGHLRTDSQLHTPKSIFYSLLLALPVCLFFALAGLALRLDGQELTNIFGVALLQMAFVWLIFNSFYRLLGNDGIAIKHFRWAPEVVSYLRTKMRWITTSALFLVAIVTVAQQNPEMLDQDVLGFILLNIFLLVLGVILLQLALFRYQDSKKKRVKRFLGVLLACGPLFLMGLLAFGYYYTTLQLVGRLIDTLNLVIVWVVLEATIVRGLAVAARRLAWHRALQNQQAQHKEGESDIAIEEPRLDLSLVNQQSLRMCMLVLWASFFILLYWIWIDLLSVISYLDNIVLYQTIMGSGDNSTIANITLRSLLNAAVVAGITTILARNLPGLLEMMVLSRINLAQGSAYAATTMLSYLIVATGAVLFFALLGVTWDKLQWLVTALMVGLGFGLQEIFANFVSGIILLFERPIRIGDVVTISGQSGTVSRIRIRATTIIDFDRKEMVIPNRVFVTSSLTNWTLSDSITRIVLVLGFAYETDLPKARQLIQQALKENPRVMRDPAASIVFTGISASTFDHEVRFYVRELSDRSLATDEMLNHLSSLFREHEIDMAFNQLDVFIKNTSGQEIQIESKQKPA